MKEKIECKLCGEKYTNISDSHLKKHGISQEEYRLYDKSKLKENIDYLECKICGEHVKILSSHLSRKHKISGEIYKEKFPGSILVCDSVNNKTKGDKHHMKTDKMRKLFSEMFKGENNINSKKNSSELERKERSPRNIEFYKKRFPDNYEEEFKKYCERLKQSKKIGNPSSTSIQYWLNKGLNREEAQRALKERQATFSLEKCVKKYGKELGLEKFLTRQKKWHQNYTKNSYSKISQELFISIIENLNIEDREKCRFATCLNGKITEKGNKKNWEKSIKTEKGYLFPDFVYMNKIIEFDGVYYHKNTPENIKRSKERDDRLKVEGYSILHIWENEYKENKELIIQKCLDFLNSDLKPDIYLNKNNYELF